MPAIHNSLEELHTLVTLVRKLGASRESVPGLGVGLEVGPGLGHVTVRREETRSGALKDGVHHAPPGSAPRL